MMIILLILIQIVTTNSNNMTDFTFKNYYIPNIFKNHRLPRCSGSKFNKILGRNYDLGNSERFGNYLKPVNNSGCFDGVEMAASNIENNILNGLLVDPNVGVGHWNVFKSVFKKRYCSKKHETSAFAKWRRNLQRVVQHNQQFLSGLQSYSLHLNHFGDLATEDYFKKILKLIETPWLFDPAEDHHKTAFVKNLHKTAPREVDWRKKGFRPLREEQSQCGACYAFAVTHALQAQLYKAHRQWTELSPQQILDCSYKDGNSGCGGGSLRAALRYVAREGLVMETSYPYRGKEGQCQDTKLEARAKPRRWAMLPFGDEKAMEKALATIGPLAVAVNAEPFTFQLYKSGIYDDIFCTPWKLNHAMLLVGYTPQYWVLLNWWGKNWGEDGYMRIRRGFNRCGVANMAAYVEL